MTEEEIVNLVAQAADVAPEELTTKKRSGIQIKANALFEGSSSPASPRKRAGVFFATDSSYLAVEGAIRRMSLDVPFPEAIVAMFDAKGQPKARVFGYADSPIAVALGKIFGVNGEYVQRPVQVAEAQPIASLDSSLLERALAQTPNVILQGPPGTGKSSTALELIRKLAATRDLTAQECRLTRVVGKYPSIKELLGDQSGPVFTAPVLWEMIQLHPNYSYDDLVRRIVPKSVGGALQFSVEDQLLPKLCQIAAARQAIGPVVLVMDEINRCNLAATLGEFIFAIDPNHRGTAVRLQYQGAGLDPAVAAPRNLWIVGTMNTADRSTALVDYAVRRRFRFIDVPARSEIVRDWYAANPKFGDLASSLLDACNAGLNERQRVGHSTFLIDAIPEATWPDRLARSIAFQVVPLLFEYAKEGLRSSSVLNWGGADYPLQSQRAIAVALAAFLRAQIAEI